MFLSVTLDAFAEVDSSPENIKNKDLQNRILPSGTFDSNDLKTHTDTVTLKDGARLTVGAESVLLEHSCLCYAGKLKFCSKHGNLSFELTSAKKSRMNA